MEGFFSTSPQSVAESHLSLAIRDEHFGSRMEDENNEYLSLAGFLEQLPFTVEESKHLASEGAIAYGSTHDPITKLFKRTKISYHEWLPYAFYAEEKSYTRNLIATDHKTYSLLLLCWNPGRGSPIHDHPCDGCYMQVLKGQIQECRYDYSNDVSANGQKCLECIKTETFQEGQLAYINDSLGYHKVGNPTKATPAATLHLYCPPIHVCNVWLKEDQAPCKSYSCHYSEYGVKTAHEARDSITSILNRVQE